MLRVQTVAPRSICAGYTPRCPGRGQPSAICHSRFSTGLSGRVTVDAEKAGTAYPFHVAIENGVALAERNAQIAAGSRRADAGQGRHLLAVARKLPPCSAATIRAASGADYAPGCSSQPAPQRQHLVLLRRSRSAGGREQLRESAGNTESPSPPGLLQHDSGQPNPVRIAAGLPGASRGGRVAAASRSGGGQNQRNQDQSIHQGQQRRDWRWLAKASAYAITYGSQKPRPGALRTVYGSPLPYRHNSRWSPLHE